MSSSFVPKVKMSKGTSKKTKFDVSSNTHTTAEVGYLQPTFSKLLMPNSDLTIKSHDSILLSSLVVPTFGDLSLRSWYMATPVSSLWTPLGCFLTQRECVDSDDNRGYSIPQQMPRVSMMSLLHYLISIETYKKANQYAYWVDTPDLLAGNLTFAFHRSGEKRSNLLLSFDELIPASLRKSVFDSGYDSAEFDNDVASYYNSLYGSTRYPMNIVNDDDDIYYDIDFFPTKYYYGSYRRYTSNFPWWVTGLVIRNTDSLRYMLTKKNTSDVIVDGNNVSLGSFTTFPTPSECPYVVVFVRHSCKSILVNSDYNQPSDSQNVVQQIQGGLEFIPLTNKMFQGDINPALYAYGWRNDVTFGSVALGTPINKTLYFAYHPTGESTGWSLGSDDSYFTGDLGATKFDFCAYQPNSILSQNSPTIPTEKILFYAAGNWSRRFKRLRKLFIGLGTQFNPTGTSQFTPWKLFAYYKSWFDNFHPKRDMQYYQTPLARLTNYLSYHGNTWKDDFLDVLLDFYSMTAQSFGSVDLSLFNDFSEIVFDCADAKYLMPLDYFTLADIHPLGADNTLRENISTPLDYSVQSYLNPPSTGQSVNSAFISSSDGEIATPAGVLNAWAIKMADKMLSYLTKKRVVGKSVSDSMRAMFGSVDEHDKAHESTWCFGTSSTPINISAVMSQAETEEMHLGDYAGRGLGGSSSRQFRIENNADLLVVVVMSAIVPRLGYYQGDLHENSIGTSPNDFCKTIYDAVGYEDVMATEYISDVMHYEDNSSLGTHPENRYMRDLEGKSLGLVPRYSWYKVARDVVNGDMSLPSTKESMSPYVMTRDVDRGFSIDPLEMRTVDPDSFNKIFNESSSLDDHFIIQVGYSVDMFAPLKSLSTSFDDFDVDEDGTIEVEHA